MIIKDVDGGTLFLSKTRLMERTFKDGVRATYPSWALFKDLTDAPKGRIQLHCKLCPQGLCGIVDYDFEYNQIGCRTFSPATFAKILKAAGVVRKTDKRKKKVAQ